MGKDGQAPEKRVADAFNAYLRRRGLRAVRIEPEDVTLGSRRAWYELEDFWIAYRIDPDDGGFPSLELYIHHPWMDDWHVRIWADSYVDELEAMHLWFRIDPEVPGSKEVARQENSERNRAIALRLHERGLCPQRHVHSFRRSTGSDPFLKGSGLADGPEGE